MTALDFACAIAAAFDLLLLVMLLHARALQRRCRELEQSRDTYRRMYRVLVGLPVDGAA
jgi:hypothetical protein